ncbi:MAG: pyruvate-formate lyase [Lachnospiraceae bacterium]|nr:pyruvate-formate lyase [Lachnospiraceae bacterium]
MNTGKVNMSPLYLQLIKNMQQDKIAVNDKKIERWGNLNIDDHGFIDFPEFTFEAEVNEEGKVFGGALLGKNFRRFLNEAPKYINENSALATCWPGDLGKFMPLGIAEADEMVDELPIWEKYDIHQPGYLAMNHLCPDMEIGLKLGWQGILDKIRYYKKKNRPVDMDFYDGEEQLVMGIIEWVEAHAKYADELAAKEEDPFKKANYEAIAAVNHALAVRAPETFREAVQFLAHFQALDRMYFNGGGLGALDRLLEEYYDADIEKGILTEEEAVWMIASLFYNDTHYEQIGGLTAKGDREVTSRVSFVILDAMHHLHIPINLAIRVHEPIEGQGEAPEILLKRAVEYTLEDGAGVCYSLEKGIVEGFARNGYPLELGRMRFKVGCNWVALPGIEYPLQDVTRLNMAQALYHALKDLEADKNYSMDHLWERYCEHMAIMVDSVKRGYDKHYENLMKNHPELVLNLFMHGTIERGLDCSKGGVDIYDLNMDGIALATVADSFAAIEQRVVEEGKISWERLFELLNTNYENAERERLMLKNIRRFGSPESPAEKWAVKCKDLYVALVTGSKTPKYHLVTVPGLFSHGDVYAYGENLAATPNGRFAGEPISHSTEPDPGFARGVDTFSPALKANAVALTQAGYGNSAPLHLDIDTGLIENEGGADALVALIHAHEQAGGTLINMNCVSKEKLMAAHEDPKKYPDLVVRVTGYSAFFASLSKEYRQQIVDRFLA